MARNSKGSTTSPTLLKGMILGQLAVMPVAILLWLMLKNMPVANPDFLRPIRFFTYWVIFASVLGMVNFVLDRRARIKAERRAVSAEEPK